MIDRGPETLNELFVESVRRHCEREFLRHKVGGRWASLSFEEVWRRVRELSLGLYEMGIRPGDRVAIWSENRPEWNVADLAVLAIGAIDVPIYANESPSQVEFIVSDSGARAIFVSSVHLADALRVCGSARAICFDGGGLSEVTELGRALLSRDPDLYERLWRAVGPEDLATLIYTSGTTGRPKGVMLTHRNLTRNALRSARWLGFTEPGEVALSYLPLAHIFERSAWYTYMCSGAVVAYAESMDAILRNLAELRPTVMTSVPRLFEKIYARLVERGLQAPFPRRQIFFWALDVARRWAKRKDSEKWGGLLLDLQHWAADLLVYRKLRGAFGGRLRVFISGGAPLAPEIGYLFMGIGLTILQGYGLTETSPLVSCNTESRNRIGTVGPVVDGVSVRIAEDGEILVKGDNVMKGYYNRPEESAEAFTEDGWLRTGDLGYIDEAGFLVIVDRKKDLIKTSGGKYVAPQKIESLIKASNFVSQVVVVGDGRKYPVALIVPNKEALRSYAQLRGIRYGSDRELLSRAEVLDLMMRQVEKYTCELAQYERVKRIALLEREFGVESGELTLTLKPRRRFIEEKYKQIIDSLYEKSPAGVAAVGGDFDLEVKL
jgi:long-chain acyl-CoA synthetase